MTKQLLYFDYAAATPLSDAAFAAMRPYFSEQFYNPSATYLAALAVKKDLETARADIAKILGARPLEITFTAGGTEANNLAIHGVMRAFPGKKVLVSSVEHESVLAPAEQYTHELIPVDSSGIVDLAALENMIDDDTVLISVMLANNEVGSIEPVAKIGRLIDSALAARKARGNVMPLYLHSDACQAGLYLDVQVARLGVNMLTLNGGKLYGPKQSGLLYVQSGVVLHPQIVGGGQERGKRSGTENVAFAVGLARALSDAQKGRGEETARLQTLQQLFISEALKAIPSVIINGSQKHRLPNNVHLTIPGCDNERVLFGLDEHGVLAAAGSACSASNEEPSHVLRAMGKSEAEAQSSLRFTMGKATDDAAVFSAIKALKASL